jgi:hypothetical protein
VWQSFSWVLGEANNPRASRTAFVALAFAQPISYVCATELVYMRICQGVSRECMCRDLSLFRRRCIRQLQGCRKSLHNCRILVPERTSTFERKHNREKGMCILLVSIEHRILKCQQDRHEFCTRLSGVSFESARAKRERSPSAFFEQPFADLLLQRGRTEWLTKFIVKGKVLRNFC